jgi:hypothetical protein
VAHPLAQDDADRVVVGDQVVRDDAAAAEALAGPPRIAPLRTGCGVLLKKLRSRWLVFEPTYCRSSAGARPELALDVEAPLVLAARSADARVGEIMSAPGRPDEAGRRLERQRRVRRSEVYVVTAASGGLLVRNVNEFIWFGL